MAHRRKKQHNGWLCLLLLLMAVLYGYLGNVMLQTTRFTFSSSRLPDGFDGCRIIVLSDLHGAEFGEGNQTLFEKVALEQPDFIFYLGDLEDRYRGAQDGYAAAVAEGLTDLPIELLNTHGDVDHVSGNVGFDRFYMAPEEEENYRSGGGGGELVPVGDGSVIDLGDRPLEVILVPGHTPGSIAVLDKKNRVMVGGDTIQDSTLYMFSPRGSMRVYCESLKKLLKRVPEFDEVYTSHGSFPVKSDLVAKLLEGAESIVAKTAEGRQVTVLGSEVMEYHFPYAGFYCPINDER